MKITFSDQHAETLTGVNFAAEVDGQAFLCIVSDEALQDINPSNALAQKLVQYSSNVHRIRDIAKKKILAGQTSPIQIFSADVV
ncbi:MULTISPECIES: DUF1488 family protein [unclassified Pseudomonas]|uniref:DUF1488 family protein n=1 Tax=unclassified Pseudomonas TaxID=196821 RepID=UPI000C869439|nr:MULTISPECIES: DUF1488 family protein [unclassified Pseudomonas]PMV22648.1 hypothetical protein C1X17_13660 [Pseudomonas sp. FW305-3-2-15-C-TSA2]PMV29311.1 hypothetical protein C1X22_11230 [Pseudomonas sp. DP16D-L5]PMV39214.1 hypothetical protein C1X21_11345 [Pseudomonas sp. FW305-3-2-15-A-LB2]PMV45524.1 hypothetical protein C1X16_12875 [Pseudomonas sp. FW305-3-2-15-C-R2A1]PMV52033.1 hypothetical protein C1X18_12075 [Pseudomonas sp. FW305-3-2-15-C-LB1]